MLGATTPQTRHKSSASKSADASKTKPQSRGSHATPKDGKKQSAPGSKASPGATVTALKAKSSTPSAAPAASAGKPASATAKSAASPQGAPTNLVSSLKAQIEAHKQELKRRATLSRKTVARDRDASDNPENRGTLRKILGGRGLIRKTVDSPSISLKPQLLSQALGQQSLKSAMNRSERDTDVPSLARRESNTTEIMDITAADLNITAVDIDQPSVPRLAYGLDRVLFNPGVYHLQDPRSRVYNFDPYLQKIMPVAEFDFGSLKDYVTSSHDQILSRIAKQNGKKYVGSTSSMTGSLSHFHYLLSQWRKINTRMLSRGFPEKFETFTLLNRSPSAIFLRWKNGTHAIDADKEFDSANVLMMLGRSMEKLLVLPKDHFERYRTSDPREVTEEERNGPEAYHYSTMGDFLMRSQLDAYDPRLPGTGMFDLKTRAVVSIRMDTASYEQGAGYQIRHNQGQWESFEREYYDMIRSTMLKYSLQVRMGRMDGIFLAYHNVERIFGFQYVSISEMDLALHGQSDTVLGDQEFKISLELLNKILDRATAKFPEQSIRIHFETRDAVVPFMYIFAEPVTEEEADQIQNSQKAKIQEFERDILGLHQPDKDNDLDSEDRSGWEDIQAKVEEEMQNDEMSTRDGEEVETGIVKGNDRELDADSDGMQESDLSASMDAVESEQQDGEAAASVEEEGDEEEDNEEDGIEEDREKDEEDAESEVVEVEGSNQGEDANHEKVVTERNEEGDATAEVEGNEEFRTDEEANGAAEVTDAADAGSGAADDQSEADSPTADGRASAAELDPTATAQSSPPANDAYSDTDSGGDAVFLNEISAERAALDRDANRPLLAMTLTVRSRVNGKYVPMPTDLTSDDKWAVEYSLAEIPSATRAWALYTACQDRRKNKLEPEERDEENVVQDYYRTKMREMSEKGREWRRRQDERDREGRIVVYEPFGVGADVEAEPKPNASQAHVKERIEDVEDYMDWLYKESGRKKGE
ncbi:hypothetical protein B0A49_00774 [Cryomyces minteri]|uniref:Uncharacterized protein n=1 Tax=Cryomyces minteri TaxID=331657 RepID=A0A4U0XP64_9PEZI|nr:hypothetical protein B0A49_00774 [Cryomyces minteri]